MEMLQGLGLKTDENEDVLGLAGVDLCGVGVRRPEVYIKRGNGVANPFITLRHAEWGHTMAFNLVSTNLMSAHTLITVAGGAPVVN